MADKVRAGRMAKRIQTIVATALEHEIKAVSYTHLTLPTNREV